MLLTLAVVLFVGWLLGLIAFEVSSWTLHLLLLVALVVAMYHFVRGRHA